MGGYLSIASDELVYGLNMFNLLTGVSRHAVLMINYPGVSHMKFFLSFSSCVLIFYSCTPALNSEVSSHLPTLKEHLKDRACYTVISGGDCGNYSIEEFSRGETKGMKAFIVRIKWDEIGPKGKAQRCSVVHYVKEDNVDSFIQIIMGTPGENDDCKNQVCAGCGEEKFSDVVSKLGYTGKMPE